MTDNNPTVSSRTLYVGIPYLAVTQAHSVNYSESPEIFGGKLNKSFGGDQMFRGRAKCFAGIPVYFGESMISPKHTKTDWHLCISREHIKIAIYFAEGTNISGINKSAL